MNMLRVSDDAVRPAACLTRRGSWRTPLPSTKCRHGVVRDGSGILFGPSGTLATNSRCQSATPWVGVSKARDKCEPVLRTCQPRLGTCDLGFRKVPAGPLERVHCRPGMCGRRPGPFQTPSKGGARRSPRAAAGKAAWRCRFAPHSPKTCGTPPPHGFTNAPSAYVKESVI